MFISGVWGTHFGKRLVRRVGKRFAQIVPLNPRDSPVKYVQSLHFQLGKP